MELSWVHPGLWEEAEVIGELLLEALEVSGKGGLPANVIHAQVVICLLPPGETAHEIGRHSAVRPKQVPIMRVPVLVNLYRYFWFIFKVKKGSGLEFGKVCLFLFYLNLVFALLAHSFFC